MKINIDRLTGLFLFGTALILRMALLSKGPYHGDCLTLAYLADQALQTHQFQPILSSAYPLTAIIGAFFIFFFKSVGNQDIVAAVNLMSAVFSSLSALIFYHFVTKTWNRITAAAATLLFIFSPIFLGVSVFGNPQTPSLFFLLLSVYVLVIYYSRMQSWGYLILSAFFLGLSGACRIQDAVCLFIPLIFFILKGMPSMNQAGACRVSWYRRLGQGAAFGFVSFLPYAIFHWASHFFSPGKNAFVFKHFMYSSKYFFWLMGRNTFYLYSNFSPLGALLVLAGALFFIIKKERHLVFLLLWGLTTLIFYSWFNFSVPRYLLLSLIPLYVFLGYFFHAFFQLGKMFRATASALLLIIVFLNVQFILPPLLFRHQRSLLIDYAKWIQSHTEEGAVIFAGDDRLIVQYYAQRKMLKAPISYYEPIEDEAIGVFRGKIDSYLARGIPVYMSESVFADDPELKMKKFLKENYRLALWGRPDYECWHRGLFKQRIFQIKFFKVLSKNNI